ncbi:hypothetical protein [Azospirillum sp. B4]|uniref:hypothetical protein n=1 Tax=Azospirillum sp. B4 TaxID=95605 RepID=UPI0003469903|nr:hypothetical protein [Azospirillum sp. B4]
MFDEWLARWACFAFSISPQAFVAQMNRATAQTAQDAAHEEGLGPTMLWVKELIDDLLAREFDAGDLEFAWNDTREVDPVKAATIANIHVRAGIKTLNEARADIGYPPVPGGDRPLIYGGGVMPLDQAAQGLPGQEAGGPPTPDDAAAPAPTFDEET